MTIRELLNADWNVAWIEVTIRENETSRYIMRYSIGKNVAPSRCEEFLYEWEAGSVYNNDKSGDHRMKILYSNQIIQHYQLKNLPLSKISQRGVVEKAIPSELLRLEIRGMQPSTLYGSSSDGLHGYHIDCYVDSWCGIKGETKQIQLDEISKNEDMEVRHG